MGYVYEYGTNRLVCDGCGRTGGVRKVKCPVGWCPPPALCASCKAMEGPRDHSGCRVYSEAYKARQAEQEREPEQWARSARGDWSDGVPKGMVAVTTYAGTEVLVPKASYNPEVRGFGA